MLTADRVKTLISLDTNQLVKALSKNKYTGVSFKNSNFLGITNGNEFCYNVTYHDDSGTGEVTDKVFVWYENDRIVARLM